MAVTIDLGWWLLPLMITAISFGFSIWRMATAETSGDYGHIGQALAFLIMFGVSTILSLLAWLIWALAF